MRLARAQSDQVYPLHRPILQMCAGPAHPLPAMHRTRLAPVLRARGCADRLHIERIYVLQPSRQVARFRVAAARRRVRHQAPGARLGFILAKIFKRAAVHRGQPQLAPQNYKPCNKPCYKDLACNGNYEPVTRIVIKLRAV